MFGIHPAAHGTLQTLAYGSVTNAYTALGTISQIANEIVLTNTLNNDIMISFDGTNNHQRLPSGVSFAKAYFQIGLQVKNNTIVYVKYTGSAPTSGNIDLGFTYAT